MCVTSGACTSPLPNKIPLQASRGGALASLPFRPAASSHPSGPQNNRRADPRLAHMSEEWPILVPSKQEAVLDAPDGGPTFSVVIAAFQAAGTLGEAIDSALTQ